MAYLPCDRCGSSDAVEPYEDGAKCFSCGYKEYQEVRLKLDADYKKQKTPKTVKLTTLPRSWIDWLTQRGVTKQTINLFNLQYDELSNSIAYPIKIGFQLSGYQLRDINKKISTVRYAASDDPFYFEAIKNNLPTVVLVEDPVSALRVYQDAGINTIALLGTNLNTSNRLEIVGTYKKILVWMDGDLAGYQAAQKIVKNCAPWSDTRLIFTQKDPKDHTSDEIKFIIENMI